MAKRSILFLQGPTSSFFSQLGKKLGERGHDVYRINFNVGDTVYWSNKSAWNFRESIEFLPEYLVEKFQSVGFTDVIMLGDSRPVHKLTVKIAGKYGARIHILEEGYLRPNWITLEETGVNGHSLLPKDPNWYRKVGPLLDNPGDGITVKNGLHVLAMHELGYHVPGMFNCIAFPGYKTHRPHISPVELYGWAKRFATLPFHEKKDNAVIDKLITLKQGFYLFPLQLNHDSQIQVHSPSRGIPFSIKDVINSFFRHAPPKTKLVIKNHPLDTGFINYAGWINRLQKRLGLEGRIYYLESGNLPKLIQSSLGVVTINSSAGISALFHGSPTIALGKAIYDIEGLTYQGELKDFWNDLHCPDKELFQNFRKTVIHTTQINGGLYSASGIQLGVENCCERIEREVSPLSELLQVTV